VLLNKKGMNIFIKTLLISVISRVLNFINLNMADIIF